MKPPMLPPPDEFFAAMQRVTELPAQLDAALARIAALEERLAFVEEVPEVKSALNNAARKRFHREQSEAEEREAREAGLSVDDLRAVKAAQTLLDQRSN